VGLTERDEVAERRDILTREENELSRQIEHIVTAIPEGVDARPLADKLRELEARGPP
jgi:hypothetical protein